MFKFMKSKKGFTLVELMIVVVIMAILVAVAVPIFSAVTKNAQKKTCIGNQREIVSAIGNWLMLQDTYNVVGSFSTTGGQDAPAWGDTFTLKIADVDATAAQIDEVKGLFKTVPVCPDATYSINVEIAAGSAEGKASVYAYCSSSATYADKVITEKAASAGGLGHLIPGTYTAAA